MSGVEGAGVIPPGDLERTFAALRERGKRVVFTNGCFDLLHVGHIRLLEAAREAGDALIVAINDDDSVRRLKGKSRPIYTAEERAEILVALRSVDYVTVFAEDTPLETIKKVRPDVLVKGAEYGDGEIVGEAFLHTYGGEVVRFPMVKGQATSEVVRRIESTK